MVILGLFALLTLVPVEAARKLDILLTCVLINCVINVIPKAILPMCVIFIMILQNGKRHN